MTRSSVVPALPVFHVEPPTNKFWDHLLRFQAGACHPSRTRLFSQGNPADRLFFLRRGMVKLTSASVTGHRQVLELCFSNSLLSSHALLSHSPAYSISAETLTECQILSFPSTAFICLLQQNPEFSYAFHQLQSAYAEQRLQILEQIKTQDVPDRYIRFLQRLATELGTRTLETATSRFVLPLEDTEIASYLAISPEYFCKLQKRMQEQGLIRREGRSVLLLTPFA